MMKKLMLILLIVSITFYMAQAQESRILRFPNASQTQITFCHAGDIFVVSKSGGLARRITTSEGIEMFPRFSPDGGSIAFCGEYDGNREVYVMPSEGGEPQRLTYGMDVGDVPDRMGPNNIVMQWTDEGKKILFRTRDYGWHSWSGKLYKVSIDGGLPEELPLPIAGFASYSPDGSKLAYNRVFREFRTWKRYRGGQADDIWIYDFKTKKIEDITNNPAQDIIPMWSGNKIFFLSDRDHTMNIFVYDLNTKETRKITNFQDYDVKFPSLGSGGIAFEQAGYVWLLDPLTEKYEQIKIEIAEDFPDIRTKSVNVTNNVEGFDISPDGKRGLFCARGDIFTVPAQKGKILNLTSTSGVHDRNPVWSPDGSRIAFISDKSGTDEVYTVKPDGSDLTQITSDGVSYRYELSWSPDSKKLINSDKTMNMYIIDVDSKTSKNIAKSKVWEIRDFDWSPDSRFVTYTDFVDNNEQVVFIYSTEQDKAYQVSDKYYDSGHPNFSPDGKYLFFVSARTFNPSVNEVEWNFSLSDMSKVYGVCLQGTSKSPFYYQSDEAGTTDDQKGDGKKDDSKKSDKNDKTQVENIKIDFDGIRDRIFELPVQAGNYWGLAAFGDKVYYARSVTGKKPVLASYNLKDKKENEIGEISSYSISHDGKKIIFHDKEDYFIQDLGDKIKPGDGKLNLSDMQVVLNHREEWNQIYEESWRQMSEFFYDPNMHGVDWKAMHDKYAALLPYVHHRTDLTYLIGELIGELCIGHSYVGGGDMPKVDPVPVGLLGADYLWDAKAGNYKFKKIYTGRNWDEDTRSPLTEPGVDAKVGDYLISIDGIKPDYANTPAKLLVNKAGKYVTLKINSSPNEKGAHEYTVKTLSNESNLRYFNWVENNRHKVDSATNGRVGYVHIPDMSVTHGLKEFIKYFYPQDRKDALIVDDRYNGGGNVSPMIIERLRRILVVAKNVRNQEIVQTNPDAVMTGPIVCLLNELSASDGDLFPYQFKTLGIGKLIGKRSWGGVIGIRGSMPFLDGGYMTRPEFANFGANGQWILENVGMIPDIEVDNDPAMEYQDIDQQLNRAIDEILQEMKTDTKPKIPTVPPYPIKK